MPDQSSTPVTRRVFLGAAAGLASVIHRPAFAQAVAPSDRVRLAVIGVGNMGTGRLQQFMTHPDVEIAGICDVDARHRDAAIALVQKTRGIAPPGEGDFRRLVTRKDIDAVAIQTPDHWHAITAVRAMEAGKDVFVEKPLSYSVAEGRAMADASLRHTR
ncbi:MAG TPA: Gfo/Idh/MocA family oxidoreductase, partial [Luteitalea sp.]|nr:Gfo/Idh/MocA family oxidoreductase [Luteitalea sp.]